MKRTGSTNVLSIHFFCRNHIFFLPALWKLYCCVFVRNNQCSEKKFIFEEPQTAWEPPWCVLWALLWGFDLAPALLEISSGLELGPVLVGAEFNTCMNRAHSAHKMRSTELIFQRHNFSCIQQCTKSSVAVGALQLFFSAANDCQRDSGFEHGPASDSLTVTHPAADALPLIQKHRFCLFGDFVP